MSKFDCFLTPNASAINRARQDHLASLGFPMSSGSVLEVGAGIGLHTQFFVDRGCSVTVTEGRKDNLEEIQRRWPDLPTHLLDLDHDTDIRYLGEFDMVYCYGLLYHLGDPENAIKRMAEVCKGQIFLELICSADTQESLKVQRDSNGNDQSTVGKACRPSRRWILAKLNQYFGHGYISVTQPDHGEFPADWNDPGKGNTRAIFVGSKTPLDNPLLTQEPLQIQEKFIKAKND